MRSGVSDQTRTHAAWETAARLSLAIVGGYFVADWSMACLALGLIIGLHVPRGDAVIVSSLLGIVTYVAAILWTFREPRLKRMAAVYGVLAVEAFAISHVLAMLGPARLVGAAS